jgi:hypothetical protein
MGNAYNNASLLVTPNGYKASKIYSAKPTDGTGDLAFSRASTALRRNSAGLWEEVANNVPRLQYPVGGGCPSWLFEPQATNIVQYNTEYDNGYWNKSNVTVLANQAVSPDGTTNADLFYPTTSGNNRTLDRSISFTNGVTYTATVYIKAAGLTWYRFYGINAASSLDAVWFNIATGTIGTIGANLVSATIESQGNGWYKLTATQVAVGTSGTFYQGPVDGNDLNSVTANATNGFYVWGAQVEAGSVATSPIITAGSAVTRLADVTRLTSASSLIGQTEGTLFLEVLFNNLGDASSYLQLTDGTFSNAVIIGKEVPSGAARYVFYVIANGITIFYNDSNNILSSYAKIAIVYSSGRYAGFLNGALVASGSTSFSFSSTLDTIGLGTNNSFASQTSTTMLAKPAIIYKTALSDAEAIELTTL